MESVANAGDFAVASVGKHASEIAEAKITGRYNFVCRDKDGNIKWDDHVDNLVTNVGRLFVLDTVFAGTAYTAVTHIGLISSISYTAVNNADTMVSHATWTEAGSANAPTFAARLAPTWSAATGTTTGSKTHTPSVFTMTGGGTLKGCFVVIGGTSAIANTTGTLYSAAVFAGGDKVVANTDTVTVTYTATVV